MNKWARLGLFLIFWGFYLTIELPYELGSLKWFAVVSIFAVGNMVFLVWGGEKKRGGK